MELEPRKSTKSTLTLIKESSLFILHNPILITVICLIIASISFLGYLVPEPYIFFIGYASLYIYVYLMFVIYSTHLSEGYLQTYLYNLKDVFRFLKFTFNFRSIIYIVPFYIGLLFVLKDLFFTPDAVTAIGVLTYEKKFFAFLNIIGFVRYLDLLVVNMVTVCSFNDLIVLYKNKSLGNTANLTREAFSLNFNRYTAYIGILLGIVILVAFFVDNLVVSFILFIVFFIFSISLMYLSFDIWGIKKKVKETVNVPNVVFNT